MRWGNHSDYLHQVLSGPTVSAVMVLCTSIPVDHSQLLGMRYAKGRLSCKILVLMAVPPLHNAAHVRETATLMLTAMLGCIVSNEGIEGGKKSQDVKRVEQGICDTMTIALRHRQSPSNPQARQRAHVGCLL